MSFFSKNSAFFFKDGLNYDKQPGLYEKNSKKRKFKNKFLFLATTLKNEFFWFFVFPYEILFNFLALYHRIMKSIFFSFFVVSEKNLPS